MHASYFRATVEQKEARKRAGPGADGSKLAANGTVEQKAGDTWKLESLGDGSRLTAAVTARHDTYSALPLSPPEAHAHRTHALCKTPLSPCP
jgi:hypothetical protein